MATRRLSATRPRPLRMRTSLPTSPVAKKADFASPVHPFGIVTPPETPSCSDSIMSEHRKFSAITPTSSLESVLQSGSIREGLLEYAPNSYDYEIIKDRRLGSGRFSSVYLAQTIPAQPTNSDSELLTPPVTPTSPRMNKTWPIATPELYAIKVAADKSTVKALRNEARILSHLSQCPDSSEYIVSFHGYDVRNKGLVFTALPATLDDFIVRELRHLDPVYRNAKLCAIFLHIARALTSSLAFMHFAGVIHADIKPANILLRPDVSLAPLTADQSILDVPFTPVFADFTSSFFTDDDSKTVSAMGGGTYDFMAPELLSRPFPPPSFKSDVYALSITLLNLITGVSPFGHEGQRMRKIELIKRNEIFELVAQDAETETKFRNAARELLDKNAIDLRALLYLGMRKNPDERLDAASWSRLW